MRYILPVLLILYTAKGYSQSSDIEKQFKSLQINSSPGYVILGVEPENIQRPNSPTDFAANVQSALVNQRLQPNFAIETSPYFWGKPGPDSLKFNIVDYLISNNYWQNLARSLTFSFATSTIDTTTFPNFSSGTGLGIGMHVQLVQGSVSSRVKDKLFAWYYSSRMKGLLESTIQKLEARNNNYIDDVDGWIDDLLGIGDNKKIPIAEKSVIKNLLKTKINKQSLTAEDLPFLRRMRSDIERRSQRSLSDVNKYQFPLTREGFMLELSVANGRVAEDSNWDNLSNAKTAIWLTPSYRFNVNKDPSIIDFVDIMAVARFTANSSRIDSSDYLDLGGKLQWIHNRVSLSAEGVFRYLTDKPAGQRKGYTSKTGLTLSYKLNDLVTFKTTFGSNFNGNSTTYSEPSRMFIVGGFNFGFSSFFPSKN